MTSDIYKEPAQIIRLWVHECERVLADRMINQADLSKFSDIRLKTTRKYFPDVPEVHSTSTTVMLSAHTLNPCLSGIGPVRTCFNPREVWSLYLEWSP